MLKLIMLISLIVFVSCGKDTIIKEYRGQDGSSCTALDNDLGVLLTCNGSTFQVYDGVQGEAGQDGIDGTNGTNGIDGINAQGIEIIPLCSKTVNKNHFEIALKFPTGEFIAVASWNGGFLTQLVKTYYLTSDGFSCYFYINSQGEIVYQ